VSISEGSEEENSPLRRRKEKMGDGREGEREREKG
jgi:hypothetical protein